MKRLISGVLFLAIFNSYNAIAGIGGNTWNDFREPGESISPFGIGDLFMLVWVAISFLMVIGIHLTIADCISEKIHIVILILLPCVLVYIASCFSSWAFNLFALASVFSSIFYFFAYIDK